ncbi:MAG: hypothetical protein AAF442_00100 [Pseudomonadota bacterium]
MSDYNELNPRPNDPPGLIGSGRCVHIADIYRMLVVQGYGGVKGDMDCVHWADGGHPFKTKQQHKNLEKDEWYTCVKDSVDGAPRVWKALPSIKTPAELDQAIKQVKASYQES